MKRMNWNGSVSWSAPFFPFHNHLASVPCHFFSPTKKEAKIGEDDVEEAYSEPQVVLVHAVEPNWDNIHASSADLVQDHNIEHTVAAMRHTVPITASLHCLSTHDYLFPHAATPNPHNDFCYYGVCHVHVHASHDIAPYFDALFVVQNHRSFGRH